MTYILSQITASNKKTDLYKDLHKTAKLKLKELNKDFSWLQYAKITKRGNPRFLAHKQAAWTIIEKITHTVSKKHSSSYGQTLDTLSHLVNTTVLDELNSNHLKPAEFLDVIERSYLKKLLIKITNHPNYIPLYPWLMPSKNLSKNSWITKDLTTGNKITIIKSLKNNKTKYNLKY